MCEYVESRQQWAIVYICDCVADNSSGPLFISVTVLQTTAADHCLYVTVLQTTAADHCLSVAVLQMTAADYGLYM